MSNQKLGRTPAVSDDEIIQAGQKLTERQQRVTGFSLRKAVGNKGDANRLVKVWNLYLQSQQLPESHTTQVIPEELMELHNCLVASFSEQLMATIERANDMATDVADKKIKVSFDAISEREKLIELEMADAMTTIESLECQNVTVQEKMHEIEQDNHELRSQLASALKEAEIQAVSIADLKAEKQELMKSLFTMKGIEPQLDNSAEIDEEETPF